MNSPNAVRQNPPTTKTTRKQPPPPFPIRVCLNLVLCTPMSTHPASCSIHQISEILVSCFNNTDMRHKGCPPSASDHHVPRVTNTQAAKLPQHPLSLRLSQPTPANPQGMSQWSTHSHYIYVRAYSRHGQRAPSHETSQLEPLWPHNAPIPSSLSMTPRCSPLTL